MMTPDLIQPFLDAAATYSHGKKVRNVLKDNKEDFSLADWQRVWSKIAKEFLNLCLCVVP